LEIGGFSGTSPCVVIFQLTHCDCLFFNTWGCVYWFFLCNTPYFWRHKKHDFYASAMVVWGERNHVALMEKSTISFWDEHQFTNYFGGKGTTVLTSLAQPIFLS
jgi:hypothetical protein